MTGRACIHEILHEEPKAKKTKKSEIFLSFRSICFFDYLKTIYIDLDRIGSATYHYY